MSEKENIDFQKIKILVFDIDGVFTNTQFLITEAGDFLRTMNTRDGYALRLAQEAGLTMAVITGGDSVGVEERFRNFGVGIYRSRVLDKGPAFRDMIEEYGWDREEILYIGDDLPDIPCIEMAGIGACPADAVPEVLSVSDFVSPKKGGEYCVRDLIERILKSRNKWYS